MVLWARFYNKPLRPSETVSPWNSNTAIAQLMVFVNAASKERCKLYVDYAKALSIDLVAHLARTLANSQQQGESISYVSWTTWDESKNGWRRNQKSPSKSKEKSVLNSWIVR